MAAAACNLESKKLRSVFARRGRSFPIEPIEKSNARRWLMHRFNLLVFTFFGCLLISPASGEERTERFDRDPGWEGHNNRPKEPTARTIQQDFGYSPATSHAGGAVGEMGGLITPAAEPAYYAMKLPSRTFADRLSASGKLAFTGRQTHVLVGFFNAGTLNEWRTPNTVALRLSARGDKFLAWLEYATSRWRAGGDDPVGFPTERNPKTGRQVLKGFKIRGVHHWSLDYDPNGNNGQGVITAVIDGVKAVCNVAEGHKNDGATFNRFGILNVMKSADGGGEIWLDDVTVNGVKEDFSRDPGWDQLHNHRTHMTTNIRPRFDFGFSATRFAGGRGSGEMGGLIFRGDCRYPQKLASYADRLDDLTLDKPLRAAGKVCLRRGVTDSTVLIGFFNSQESLAVNPSQDSGLPRSFLGISTDGPSREGFLFSPTYRVKGDGQGQASAAQPHLYPDGRAHDWSLEYSPDAAEGRGQITVTLDKQSVRLSLARDHKQAGTRFNRFGLISTWIDGNSQTIYFDDLTYTVKQE
jgi:hypothetical protein